MEPAALPRLAAELAPIAGRVREHCADFEVEERLAYEPSGSGTHVWAFVEKEDLTTFELVKRLAITLGRKQRDFGYAGLKDRRALTRQWVSLEHADAQAFERVAVDGARVLRVTRHTNKVKLGHARGNAFRIRLRGVEPGALARARAILELCERRGLPNYYGAQRFGTSGATAELGRCLLTDRFDDFAELYGKEPRALPRRFLSLCTSALQSRVFNAVVASRVASLDRVGEGDLAYLHANGACFLVTDAGAEQERAERFEISPSGPMPGPSCARPEGAQAELEDEALAACGVTHESFAHARHWRQKGGRRPLRVRLAELALAEESGRGGERDLVLAFRLPAGSYASVLLDEFIGRAPA